MPVPRRCCKDCEKRTPECHCTCEDYKAYKKELDEYNEIVRTAKAQDRLMRDYQKANYRKRVWKK